MSRIGLGAVALLTISTFVGGTATTAPMTVRVSTDIDGGDANGTSSMATVSRNARFVLFHSAASDLVPNDGNAASDVFIRDVVGRDLRRLSVDTAGGDADGPSFDPAVTHDGRFAAFDSAASDLVADDGNAHTDVFVRDMLTGQIRRVSVDAAGGDSNNDSFSPVLSANGRFVAFWSSASDLVPNDLNHVWDVFIRDMVGGRTARVSVAMDGGDPDLDSEYPSISADGRFVAFTSAATNLVPGDRNGNFDIFIRDMVRGVTRRISVVPSGGDADGSSHAAAITPDARYVAFYSVATDLVPDDRNFYIDVFRADLVNRLMVRVSVDTAGGDSNGASFDPSITADGRFVSFRSAASDLVAGDSNGNEDVFVRDLEGGVTTPVSVSSDGGNPNGISYSYTGAIDQGGNVVAFWSFASNLVAGDDNDVADVFVRRLS